MISFGWVIGYVPWSWLLCLFLWFTLYTRLFWQSVYVRIHEAHSSLFMFISFKYQTTIECQMKATLGPVSSRPVLLSKLRGNNPSLRILSVCSQWHLTDRQARTDPHWFRCKAQWSRVILWPPWGVPTLQVLNSSYTTRLISSMNKGTSIVFSSHIFSFINIALVIEFFTLSL